MKILLVIGVSVLIFLLSGGYYVFDIPVAETLDLKKAAKAVGEKSIAMLPQKELLPLTGYVHGGCSPVGMKKKYPTTMDETAILFDKMRENMSLEVIHLNHRNIQRRSQSFSEGNTHQQRTHKTRTAGKGNGTELFFGNPGPFESSVNHRHNILLMGTRRKLGDYTTVLFVDSLACSYIGKHYITTHHGSRRIVAR